MSMEPVDCDFIDRGGRKRAGKFTLYDDEITFTGKIETSHLNHTIESHQLVNVEFIEGNMFGATIVIDFEESSVLQTVKYYFSKAAAVPIFDTLRLKVKQNVRKMEAQAKDHEVSMTATREEPQTQVLVLVICPYCGTKNEQGILFCQKCGAGL